MKKSHRKAGLLVGLASVIALPLVGAAPASAATPDSATTSATWSFGGHNQYCVKPDRGHPRTYAIGQVEGTWTSTITAGLRNLPPGSTSDGVVTLAPGTTEGPSGGSPAQLWFHLSIAPAPAGTYTAEFWATDGKVTQTDPVTIKVSEECA
ncbi:DUF5980 family protein [Streptomyces sp. enrichment culture]|uniref:DUF5980 family protein n=1 Tax=Streptomyces sp. enrichment culture TaxID=1795815 RepID=UPI003F5492C6